MLRSSPASLFSDLDVDVMPDAPIGGMTWYGIGGRADLLVRPRSREALATLMKRGARSQIPIRVLGNGANLLIDDDGVDGIVIKLDTPAFRSTSFDDEGDEAVLHTAAGVDLAKTVMETARRGLEGLSMMAGIPASIGGAIRMNAGGAYGAIESAVESVTCVSRHGEIIEHEKRDLAFGYRETNLREPIIIAATFRLHAEDPITVRDRVKAIFEYKKSSQPLAEHSAGCSFKNPIDPETDERVSAGRLIDAAGLKGTTNGGASVSQRHANFIVVEPGTSARDVITLMDDVARRVYEHAGIELEREVVVWQREQASS